MQIQATEKFAEILAEERWTFYSERYILIPDWQDLSESKKQDEIAAMSHALKREESRQSYQGAL